MSLFIACSIGREKYVGGLAEKFYISSIAHPLRHRYRILRPGERRRFSQATYSLLQVKKKLITQAVTLQFRQVIKRSNAEFRFAESRNSLDSPLHELLNHEIKYKSNELRSCVVSLIFNSNVPDIPLIPSPPPPPPPNQPFC